MMAADEIERELRRLEAETGKSRSALFREWFKQVSAARLREKQDTPKEDLRP